MQLICTELHTARYVCEKCKVMDTYGECLYCQEIAPISVKKNPNMINLAENYLNNEVLEISMYDFVDRDRPLDDNFNEPMHES